MIDYIRNRPILSAVAGLFLLIVLVSSFPIVPETKQALVVRFGEPVRVLNHYQPNHPIGSVGAGLGYRIPFAEQIVWIDKRVLSVGMDSQQVISTDQRRLEVDAFARYRIVDPQLMYIRAATPENLNNVLRINLGSQLRNELGKRPFAALLSPEREGIMDNVRLGLDRVAAQYGAHIVDVRIKHTDLPQGSPLDSAFERMRSARELEAQTILANGQRQARVIQAEADAEAARIYAESYGKDADFYDFYRAMQSYEVSFVGTRQQPATPTTVVLSPQNDYLKEFTGRSR
jgi:membrane protease subunit HflC